jgi:ABC-2 type transport system permease protein
MATTVEQRVRRPVGKDDRNLARLWAAVRAFMQLGWKQAISYPLAFIMNQLSTLLPVVIFFFVSRLIANPGRSFGSDYFSSVMIGLIGLKLLDTGLRGFGMQVDIAINRGWLEMFLVEPVRWRFLPIAISQWPIAQGLFSVGTMLGLTLLLGADFTTTGIPAALLIGLLGTLAGLAIGTFSAAVKVLAKSGDPVLYLYTLSAQLFSGVYFSVESLPSFLQPLSFLLPHTYVIQGLRRVLLPDGAELPGLRTGSIIWTLLIFSVVGYPLAIWTWGRALEYGRKLGVLSGY